MKEKHEIISVMIVVGVCPVINMTCGQDIRKHRTGVSHEMTWLRFPVWGWDISLMSVLLQTCFITIMTCFFCVLAHSDIIHDGYLSIHHCVASLERMQHYSAILIECHCHNHSINAACLFIHTFIHLSSMPYNLSS
jgi:hypothetical protein